MQIPLRGRRICQSLSAVIPLALLLAVAVLHQGPVSAQGSCGDNVCDPEETARTCPDSLTPQDP